MKPVRGFFSMLKQTNPSIYERLFQLYANGKWVVGYKYLPEERRRRILEKLRPIIVRRGLSFASCREGFSQFNTALCDGTACCRKLIDTYFR